MAQWDSRHEMAIGARATPQLLGCPDYGREGRALTKAIGE
jgi:hypothetical protein